MQMALQNLLWPGQESAGCLSWVMGFNGADAFYLPSLKVTAVIDGQSMKLIFTL